MTLLRYLLILIGISLLVGAAGILVWDLYQILKTRSKPAGEPSSLTGEESPVPRWQPARRLAAFSMAPLLMGWSITAAPSGAAGVRHSISGHASRIMDDSRLAYATTEFPLPDPGALGRVRTAQERPRLL
jgi:hypothetical protein